MAKWGYYVTLSSNNARVVREPAHAALRRVR